MTYNSQIGTYVYNDPNHVHAVKQAGPTTYNYDNNGNMTSGDGRTITWNYDNMPSSITMGGTTSFVYDYQKQRVKKIGSSTTIYIGTLYEITGGSYTKYIFAGKKRIVNKTVSATNYYHTDHLGSSNVITNASGTLVEEIYYFPFGGIRLDTGSVDVKHKYTGQELDEETDLYYYGARYYDAVLARFISPDSVVPDYTDPQSLNRYSYVVNNPLRYIDPTGNQYTEEDLAFGNIWAGSIYSSWSYFSSSASQSSNWSITTNLYPYSSSSMTYTEYLLSGGSSSGFSTGAVGTNVSQGFNVVTGSEYMIMSQGGAISSSNYYERGVMAAYGETSGLYPQQQISGSNYNPRTWNPESYWQLQDARTAIAEISERNSIIKLAMPVANNPIEQMVWQYCRSAADPARFNLPPGVRHFFMFQFGVGPQTPWWAPPDVEPYRIFGPFINTPGGRVAPGPEAYILLYRGIP